MEKIVNDNNGRIISCNDIIRLLEEKSPKHYACEWDNVGLLLGRREKTVKRIMVALDATMEVVNTACDMGCDMLVTHHPLIFSSLKTITDESILGEKLLLLAEHGITYYAMHTNFDTVGSMSQAVVDSFLALNGNEPIEECDIPGQGMGRYAFLPKPMTSDEICDYIKEHLELEQVTFYPATPDGVTIPGDKVFDRIAVMPGSGKSFIGKVVASGCELYLTGDIGYHEAQSAAESGLSIIDATHDGLEKVFARFMADYLMSNLPLIDIEYNNFESRKIPYFVIMDNKDN